MYQNSLRKAHRKMLRENPTGTAWGTTSLEIQDDGIYGRSPNGEGKVFWSAIGGVNETETHVFIQLKNLTAYVIPRSGVKEEQLTSFL